MDDEQKYTIALPVVWVLAFIIVSVACSTLLAVALAMGGVQ